MTIKDINNGIVTVMIGQWFPDKEAHFPIGIIPEGIKSYILVGNLLLAKVNLDADKSEDLIFEDFEIPDQDIINIINNE